MSAPSFKMTRKLLAKMIGDEIVRRATRANGRTGWDVYSIPSGFLLAADKPHTDLLSCEVRLLVLSSQKVEFRCEVISFAEECGMEMFADYMQKNPDSFAPIYSMDGDMLTCSLRHTCSIIEDHLFPSDVVDRFEGFMKLVAEAFLRAVAFQAGNLLHPANKQR